MKHIIYKKDCIELLKEMDDNSIDVAVLDPPYFEIVKNDWDNQWKSEQEYLDWCMEWTKETVRVLKPGKPLYVWGTTKTDTFLKYKLDVLNKQPKLVYQNWIIWSYDWGGRTKKKFARKHEDLLVYSKGKSMDFFADQVLVERAVKKNMNIERKINLLKKYQKQPDTSQWNEKDIHSWKKYKYDTKQPSELTAELSAQQSKSINFAKGKIPTDVWQKNNHTTSKEYAGWHPTQKPIELLQRIIKGHTEEGDVVFDCFSGSGSTMIAAANCNRSFIGTEIDKDYHTKSIERYNKLVDEDKRNLIIK
jgi:DNA modification methylase